MFTVKPCKEKGGMSAKPLKNIRINLDKIRSNFKVVMDTPVLVVIETDDHQVIVHNYGELIFKDLTEEDKIRQIAEKIYEVAS